jgi:phosphatidylglycerol:prolipoprotein diacylglycerol transferase
VTEAFVGLRFPRALDEEGAIIGSPPFLKHLRQGLVAVSHTRSLPVHPTQLYEVAYNLVIFAVLTYAFSRRRRAGDVAWLYPIGYGAARFCNEFVRADTAGVAAFGGLTIFQLISLLMIAFGVTMSVLSRRRPAEPMPEPWEPPIEEQAASR